ncbi:protein of unknown function [Candidatus Methylomirabilis oxygeniifera]|uniref:Uncharacterized protein n=1 Tax=Methylomirabilis oxygeniifera TaxID=671143 RepID=D5MMV8_METO1|nr:protein of unknown function [Candidatus Methylomirabilis oxyfera]
MKMTPKMLEVEQATGVRGTG